MIMDRLMVDKLGPIITILLEHPAISRDAGTSSSLSGEKERERRGRRERDRNCQASCPTLKLGVARKGCCTTWCSQIMIPVCLHTSNRVDETVGDRQTNK